MRKRYLITYKSAKADGRAIWRMDRRGKLSPADIIKIEKQLSKECGTADQFAIINIREIS